jgi:transposase-like protein
MHREVDVPAEGGLRQEAFWTAANDWVKGQVTGLLETVLKSCQQERLAAGWNQRNAQRAGWRNGFYYRSLLTPHGLLQLKIPRCRDGSLDCSMLFERYQRRLADVDRILRRAYLLGTSTRATAQLAEQVFGGSLSHQTVSQLGRWLDEQLRLWRNRPLQPWYRAVFIDGMHLDCQEGDQVVVLVMGLLEDGRHEVLGFSTQGGESCRELLWDLRQRGLEHVDLFVSDDSASIRSAIAEVFPLSAWQSCSLHRLMALRERIGPTDYRQEMVGQASCIFRCPTKLAALDQAHAWQKRWGQIAPGPVQSFMEGLSDSLAFYSLPETWWKRTRTNNLLERLIRTLRMRLRNMGCFYDKPAVERAVFGQLARWHLIPELTHTS